MVYMLYYRVETKKYYDVLVNRLPSNSRILEIGSGCGQFYVDHSDQLKRMNNSYHCIDLDTTQVEFADKSCPYVKSMVRDIRTFTSEELRDYDVLLLVQSYVQIENIESVFQMYLSANPHGSIYMINTIFPEAICELATFIKQIILPNQPGIVRKSLSIERLCDLELVLDREFTNEVIGTSLSGFDQYLTII